MQDRDKELVAKLNLRDIGIKETKCNHCTDGRYTLERVINGAGVPYSAIVCNKCGAEPMNMPTADETRLIAYAKQRYGRTA